MRDRSVTESTVNGIKTDWGTIIDKKQVAVCKELVYEVVLHRCMSTAPKRMLGIQGPNNEEGREN